ncbi:hypothetical protein KEJ27_06140 [Candidatus Bathyarchaeota archaeon]|nr:hypothetical protein [Candidatus Bathyarchaeota archaeon]MBS7613860.1 hypothetical protein [Candidatus Bathyarchaeota archaeon]MBS7618523.1 hypothetical protein [Candidatus Bathyarchaeota archaeon]
MKILLEMYENVKIKIRAELNPTEDAAKVEKAIRNIVPSARVRIVEEAGFKYVVGEAESLKALEHMKAKLKARRIRDAARVVMLKWMEPNRVVIFLNKQVSFAGSISFSEPYGESPLGPIRVEIETEDPKSVINWLTSKEST